ncbi:hypothetical protein HDU76_001617 [Blyttiomyces sp. JEL0837]|nr:hypothetical protein HDU76_001617 [Blyttiomyces sp. JEL0837]
MFLTRSLLKRPLISQNATKTFILVTRSSPSLLHRQFTTAEDRTYHKFADHRLESLLERFEDLGDQVNINGFDVMYSNGVLTLKTGKAGTYVINKQPPNKQIWLSSPVRQETALSAGPRRFDLIDKSWRDTRDSDKLEDLLSRELSEIFEKPIDLVDDSEVE